MKVRRIDFSPDEWLAGANRLDNATRGLYITACALIYSHGGPIDIDDLKAACRDHGHAFNRQFEVLIASGKLSINGRQIINKRAINELQKAEERSEKARQNVGKRWNGNGLETEPVLLARNANHQPSTTNHHITPKSPHEGTSNGKGGRRANGTNPRALHDPFGHKQLSGEQLRQRFNDKTITREEKNAIRQILFPGAPEPGF